MLGKALSAIPLGRPLADCFEGSKWVLPDIVGKDYLDCKSIYMKIEADVWKTRPLANSYIS